jgi:hypothetical protein
MAEAACSTADPCRRGGLSPAHWRPSAECSNAIRHSPCCATAPSDAPPSSPTGTSIPGASHGSHPCGAPAPASTAFRRDAATQPPSAASHGAGYRPSGALRGCRLGATVDPKRGVVVVADGNFPVRRALCRGGHDLRRARRSSRIALCPADEPISRLGTTRDKDISLIPLLVLHQSASICKLLKVLETSVLDQFANRIIIMFLLSSIHYRIKLWCKLFLCSKHVKIVYSIICN